MVPTPFRAFYIESNAILSSLQNVAHRQNASSTDRLYHIIRKQGWFLVYTQPIGDAVTL